MSIITVFTPTYNRAYCLSKCYESLKRQTNQDFVWLIIDDGSTDNTSELVDTWCKEEHEFIIRYVFKSNGGMHTAYNTAYDIIDSELAMNVDSDDYLTDTAIEDIATFWGQRKEDNIGGIYALDQYPDGKIIGTPFPDDLTEFHGWGYKKVFYISDGKKKIYTNRGDKKFVAVTRVIKQYPSIPVFEGEKYHSLYFKQHFIERDYTIAILNKPVCVVEYLEDGSSNNMYFQYIRNPKGFCNERRYVMKYAPSRMLRFQAAVHYVAESIIARNKSFIKDSTNRSMTILAVPLGIGLYWWIRKKTRK